MTANQPDQKPLESWKEIAAYLQRDVRTVRRWEKHEGLPVRRLVHLARSSVYAYPGELETWRASRGRVVEAPESGPFWRRPLPAAAFGLALVLALISVGNGGASHAAAAGDGIVARQVWAGANVDILGGVSPDGKYLSFTDWQTGDLALRDLARGENRRLTNKGQWWESQEFALISAPSPDGQRVAYAWFEKDRRFGLRLISTAGAGEPRVLYGNDETPHVHPLGWSPDGKYVVALFVRKDRSRQLALVSTEDGSARVLKTFDWRYPRKASFSPDGRTIVYDVPAKEGRHEHDIFLIAADGSREAPLVEHPSDDGSPLFAPGGDRVVFVSDRTGTPGLWSIRVAGGKAQGAAELVKPDLGRSVPLGFTREGSLYYGLNTGMVNVYTAELDPRTGQAAGPAQPAAQRFMGTNDSPEWSPDGRYLAYASRRGPSPIFEDGSKHLVIRATATGEEREIRPELNNFGQFAWSPDGRSFLVSGTGAKGRFGIYRIDAATGKAAAVVQDDTETYSTLARWAAGGKEILYQRVDRKAKSLSIVRRGLKSGQEKEVYAGSFETNTPTLAVSPDGARLAFWLRRKAELAVVLQVLPTGGGEAREVVRMGFEPVMPMVVWSRDGKELLYGRAADASKPGERKTELWRVSADGGPPRKVGLAMDSIRHLSLHPDGRRIAFAGGQYRAEVWVMEGIAGSSQ